MFDPIPIFLMCVFCGIVFSLWDLWGGARKEASQLRSSKTRAGSQSVLEQKESIKTKITAKFTSNILSIFALGTSIVAALFAWEQIEISREHNSIAVSPIIQITAYFEGKDGRNGVYISNSGMGPAILTNFTVKYKTTVREGLGQSKWTVLLDAANLKSECFATGWPKTDSVLRAGSEDVLLELTKADRLGTCSVEVAKLIQKNVLTIRVDFKSMYEEHSFQESTSAIQLDEQDKQLLKAIFEL